MKPRIRLRKTGKDDVDYGEAWCRWWCEDDDEDYGIGSTPTAAYEDYVQQKLLVRKHRREAEIAFERLGGIEGIRYLAKGGKL